MPQSTVQISVNEQRERYHKALIMKIAEFKKFIGNTKPQSKNAHNLDIEIYLREAISFKNLFDIKSAVVTLQGMI